LQAPIGKSRGGTLYFERRRCNFAQGWGINEGEAAFVRESALPVGRGISVASRREAVAAEIPRLRRYARALLADDGEADDLIQDTLERALARLAQWREGDSPRKWLFSILHNLHVDGLRRKSRRPPHVGLESVGVDQSAPAADGASGRDLDQALQMLSVEQREVVLLVGLEGLSYAETADVLEIPVGTVMSRLARGRERLRVLMDYGGGDRSGRAALRRVK
jgi:RNA polymerase sigma-70 factor (ECF subfamily)